MNNKKAFSFVELIVVITIIALISVIGISINNNYTERSKNSKITSDIQTLKNSLEAYKSETKTLPAPKGNQKFFDDASNYVHYDDPTRYGVAGFITEDTIPKKYLGYLPVDPRTEQYYAYGKTLTGAIEFEIAGVNVKDGIYESKVVGNHTGESGPYNLIREYNGPDFVYDRSKNNFPYNPDERIIKGKIGSFSGEVKVNTKLVDNTWITTNELKAGDTIEVAMGGEAQIYYSDGSKSYLGDPLKASRLTLANMVYKDENNLFTKIQLALDYGTIWTKTSKLDPNSEFEIYTTDTEAAVRGTIFGVSKNTMTYVKVQTGSVEINKLTEPNIDSVINKLKNNSTITTDSLSIGGISPNLTINGNTATLSSTGTIYEIHMGTSIYTSLSPIIPTLPDLDGLSNTQSDIKSIIPGGTVVLELPSSFSGAGLKVMVGGAELPSGSGTWSANLLTMTGLTGTQEIKICTSQSIPQKCTKSVSVTTTLGYSSGCKGGELDFGTNVGCVEQDASLVASGYTLVAYAPYNIEGDLNMYKQGTTIPIEYSTAGITGSLDDNNGEIFPDGCDITTSFCDIDGVKGVFIGTGTDIPDYIKYTGLDSLDLGSNFAIEMSVRTPTTNSSAKFLFQLSDYKLYLAYSSLENRIFLKNTSLYYTGFTDKLDGNFHKIIATKLGDNYNLLIDGENKLSFSTGATIIFSEGLYIGSSNASPPSYQWNNIIDYVKIYKK